MAQGDTPLTIVGNVVAEPELRFTPSGAAVCNFRVASTPRVFDKNSNQWVDGDGLFLTCNVWREQAESVAESIQKGMRVIVNGRLRQRSYETNEGERRTVYEVEVDDVGPSLKWATAKVTRLQREGGGQRYQGGGQQGGYGGQQGGYGGQQGGYAPQGGQQGGYGGQAPMDDPWGGQQYEEAPY